MSRKRAGKGPVFPYNMDPRHASLMQDYALIQHEFEGLKDRLQAVKTKKATLSAEVRFLRRRLKELKNAPFDNKDKKTAPSHRKRQSLVACIGKTNSQAFMASVSSLPAKNVWLAA